MKPSATTLIGIFATLAQIGVGCSTWFVYYVAGLHWHELLNGKPLPVLTVFAFHLLRGIPIAFGILLVVGFAIPKVKARLSEWTSAILIIELLVLAFLFIGISLPGVSIMYRMKNRSIEQSAPADSPRGL
jgi:hypothetical protein